MFLKKLLRAAKNVISFLFILFILFLCFVYRDNIFPYILHSKAFYDVNLGDKEYKKGNYQEAIEYYNKALEIYPEHTKARYNLANIYVVYEDFPSALNEYKTVLQYDSEYLNARISLGIIKAEGFSDFDGAISEYQKAVLTPSRIINIPFLYDNREQLIKAKSIAYYNMGLAYRDKSLLYDANSVDYREMLMNAADSYEKAIALDRVNYDAQFNLALTYHLLGLYTEALTGYCKAMLLAPLNYEAHYNLAVLLKQKSMYKESYEEFKDASSLMSFKGETFQASYIYDMLAEISKMAIAEYGYEPKKLLERLDSEIDSTTLLPDDEVTLVELENAIKKRIKTASICKNYLQGF